MILLNLVGECQEGREEKGAEGLTYFIPVIPYSENLKHSSGFIRILIYRIYLRSKTMELLTKLEELILLSVWRLKDNAYGTTIYRHIQSVTEKKVSLGGVYFPLDRLTKQGFLRAYFGEATQERKGLSKRYYQLTEKGLTALNDAKRVNDIMWAGFAGQVLSRGEDG